MHKRPYFKILLFVLVAIGLTFVFSSLFFSNSNSRVPVEQIVTDLSTPEKIIPIRIQIPSIGVDAVIRSVGLTKLNTMEAPEEPEETAWFKLGATPGEKGSSVIAGHRGWRIGPAIFDDLDKIQLGEKVYVEDEKGETRTFVVREMRVYDANELVPEVWNKDDAAYLNLITCSGFWNLLTRSSAKRLVVFTDLVT